MENTSSSFDQVIKVLQALTPLVAIVLPAYLAYLFGVNRAKKELNHKRRLEVGEELGILIQRTIEENSLSVSFYERNFGRIEDFNESMERLERHQALYQQELERISNSEEIFSNAHQELKRARIYIKQKYLEPIDEYLDLCQFTFQSDVLGSWNYYQRYFENLLDNDNKLKREILEKKIHENLPKIVS